ncbi:hypothetical protein P5705_01485 [Pseudomonas entomophila]|uniref:hypothetical protein n=1 Tax=Pseudomonas entomophila TaxID=312306 RepID=UPI0024072050|nr:hypothetical protein [Pseudomonas entomophila]MDF9616303.1 hypothetical protein [Pseudomonas entomophila]
MEYLKIEIEEEIKASSIKAERVEGSGLRGLLDYLDLNFYGGCGNLDSFYMQRVCRYYDENFWRSISKQPEEFVYLLVVDEKWHAWKFERKEDLQLLINETTAFRFWLLDATRRVLVYFGDSDCVHWSRIE